MTTDTHDVTILGAGIAGLSAAVAFAGRGRSVELIERAPALSEVGAGLQIAPNGGRVLDALSIPLPAVESRAVHLIDGPSGHAVLRMPLGPGFRLVHRADLIGALANRAVELGVTPRLGTEVRAIEEEGRVLVLADGSRRPVRRLIGADGPRGPARAFVAPDHRPRFTGQVAWRATVPCDPHWPAEAQVHMGPGRHLVLYPLREGRLLNIVAVEERREWTAEGWAQEGDPDALRAAFAGFGGPVRAVLRRVGEVHLWGLMDHGVTRPWSRGACTLIGDAAHPTLPFLAQGANLALEDAWTLAAMADDPDGWEALRRPRVARALKAAAANARNYHLRGPARTVAHAALRLSGKVAPNAMLGRYAWLYDADVTAA